MTPNNGDSVNGNNNNKSDSYYMPLPSLEEVADLERKRSEAFDSLEIDNHNNQVKCQPLHL